MKRNVTSAVLAYSVVYCKPSILTNVSKEDLCKETKDNNVFAKRLFLFLERKSMGWYGTDRTIMH